MKSGIGLNRTCARRRAVVLLGAGLLAGPKTTHANSTYTWSGGNAGTGYFDVPANWASGAPPTSGASDLVFGSVNLTPGNSPYTEFNYNISSLTFNASALAFAMGTSNSNNIAVGSGGITDSAANAESFSMGLILSTSQSWNVGNAVGLLTLYGSLTNSSSSTLTKTGSGTLNLSLSGTSGISALALQAGTTQINSGTLALNQTVNGTLDLIGGSALNLSGGAVINSNANGFVSAIIDSASTVNLTGSGTALNALGSAGEIDVARSSSGTLNVTNFATVSSGDYLVVGGFNSGNTGAMSVTSGATVTTPYALFGFKTGSTGTVMVSGAGTALNASNSLELSGNTIGGTYGGTSTLTITSSGVVQAANTAFYSNNATINISGGTLNTAGLNSNASGNGAILLTSDPSVGYALNLFGTSGTYTYSGSISGGTGTFDKNGASTQILNGPINTSGQFLITGGTTNFGLTGTNTISTLAIHNATAQVSSGTLMAAASTLNAINLSSGAQFTITGGAIVNASSSIAYDVVVDGNSTLNVSGSGTQLNTPIGGSQIELGVSSVGTMTVSGGATVNTYQPILGPNTGSTGNLTVTGAGSTFNASNTLIVSGFNGTTGGNATLLITNGGVVNAKAMEFYFSTGIINVSGGTFNTGNLGSWQPGWGTILLTNPSNGFALNIDGSSGNANYSGTISGSGGINKSGGSTQTLAGTDTFTGAVLITGGELNFNSSNAAFSTLNVSSGGIARIDPGGYVPAATPINLDGGAFVWGGSTVSFPNHISLSANGGTVGIANSATTLIAATAITGTGTLTVTGPGTLSLAASGNSFGGLNISNGTLSTAILPTLSTLIFDGGTLNYGGSNLSETEPVTVTSKGGSFNIVSSGTTVTSSGTLSGAGTLTKTGPGTLVLPLSTSNSNSISGIALNAGNTQFNSGTLTVSNDFYVNGGNLQVSGGAVMTLGSSVSQGIDSGTVTVTGTGSKITGANQINLAYAASASLVVNQGGTFSTGTSLLAGGASGLTASITVNPNGAVSSPTISLGAVSGATGMATINGSGAVMTASSNLELGGFGSSGGTGSVTITNGGIVNAGATTFYSYSSSVSIGTNGGTLNTAGLSSFASGYGSISLTDLSGGYALNITGASGTSTYSGSFSGTGTLNKSGGSTQNLAGSGTIGALIVQAGTLGISGGLNASSLSSNSSSSATIMLTDPNSFTPALTLSGSANSTYSATLSGTGSIEQSGTGTLTLSGNDTATGGLDIDSGAVVLNTSNAFSTVSVGGTLQLNPGTTLPVTSTITFNGGTLLTNGNFTLANPLVMGNGTSTFNTPTGTYLNVSNLSGDSSEGTLTKIGTGTLNIAESSSVYVPGLALNAGLTQVSSGTLNLQGNITLNNSAMLNISGGTVINGTNYQLNTNGSNAVWVSGTNTQFNPNLFCAPTGASSLTLTNHSSGSPETVQIAPTGTNASFALNINGGASYTFGNNSFGGGANTSTRIAVDGAGSSLTVNYDLAFTGSGANSLVITNNASGTISNNLDLTNTNWTANISGAKLSVGGLAGSGQISIADPTGGIALTISGNGETNFNGTIAGTGSLNVSGGEVSLVGNTTFTGQLLVANSAQLTLEGTNSVSNVNLTGSSTLVLSSNSSSADATLGTGANINVSGSSVFRLSFAYGSTPNTPSTAIGTINLSGGTFNNQVNFAGYYLNRIIVGTAGGSVQDYNGVNLNLVNSGAGVTVQANSTWSSENGAITNATSSSIPINVSNGVTFTDGFFMNGSGYTLIGGGTLLANAGTSNGLSSAALTITSGTFRATDVSSNPSFSGPKLGEFGTGTFTLDGGTFSYGGSTSTTNKQINLTTNGGTVTIESSGTTLTDTSGINASGNFTKGGPGNLIVPASLSTTTNIILLGGTLGLQTSTGVLALNALTLANGTTLDIGNNAVDFRSETLSAVTATAKQGYANGTWTGTGLTSSNASSDAKHLTAVGVIQNNQGGAAMYNASHQFLNTTPGTADVLAAFTYYGDTNLSGTIDGSDYSRIDVAFQADRTNPLADTGWFNGDFNYDSAVDGSDYTLMDNAFNMQTAMLNASVAAPSAVATSQVASAVPEPASIGLLGIVSLAALSRRRFRKA